MTELAVLVDLDAGGVLDRARGRLLGDGLASRHAQPSATRTRNRRRTRNVRIRSLSRARSPWFPRRQRDHAHIGAVRFKPVVRRNAGTSRQRAVDRTRRTAVARTFTAGKPRRNNSPATVRRQRRRRDPRSPTEEGGATDAADRHRFHGLDARPPPWCCS